MAYRAREREPPLDRHHRPRRVDRGVRRGGRRRLALPHRARGLVRGLLPAVLRFLAPRPVLAALDAGTLPGLRCVAIHLRRRDRRRLWRLGRGRRGHHGRRIRHRRRTGIRPIRTVHRIARIVGRVRGMTVRRLRMRLPILRGRDVRVRVDVGIVALRRGRVRRWRRGRFSFPGRIGCMSIKVSMQHRVETTYRSRAAHPSCSCACTGRA